MKRLYEATLNEFLEMFPCVALVGPRQCGKTTLLECLPPRWRRFDLERDSDLERVEMDPGLFLRMNPMHIAVDEAQLLPSLFPALRVAIDEQRGVAGRFVITGSSSPSLLTAISESLAGRVAVIEMSPLLHAEACGAETTLCSLLVDRSLSPADIARSLRPHSTLADVHRFWFGGGYPEPFLKGSRRFHSVWMSQYVGTYLNRDIRRLFPGLNQERYRRFLGLLAGLSGTVLNNAEVARALGVSQPTVRDYFEIAHGTFLWRKVPSYQRNVLKRVVKHPKGYLRDSGLLHHLLRIPDEDALLTHPVMGHSWEGMVIEEMLRQLQTLGVDHDYSYYRTAGGAEVDLVLEGDFGLIPIEIKYTQAVKGHALRSLRDFLSEHPCRCGVVINNAPEPVLYDSNIIGIPFNHL